jgi:hypothetical protein
MKTYVITSGTIFTLLTLAHIARMVSESWILTKEPAYVAITLAAAAMAAWAWWVAVKSKNTLRAEPGR